MRLRLCGSAEAAQAEGRKLGAFGCTKAALVQLAQFGAPQVQAIQETVDDCRPRECSRLPKPDR